MAKRIEKGTAVLEMALPQVNTKKAKKHAQTTANDVTTTSQSIEEQIYDYLCNVELEKPRLSVNLSDFAKCKTAGDYENVINAIKDENRAKADENRARLIKAFKEWYKTANGFEFETFRKKFWARFRNTRGFSLTYQAESTNETTNTFESGAYFARQTTWTPFGLRTAFNSVEYCKRTAEYLRQKAETARKADENRKALSNLSTAELLQLLTPSQLANLINKA